LTGAIYLRGTLNKPAHFTAFQAYLASVKKGDIEDCFLVGTILSNRDILGEDVNYSRTDCLLLLPHLHNGVVERTSFGSDRSSDGPPSFSPAPQKP
jgi:hypothetical protein